MLAPAQLLAQGKLMAQTGSARCGAEFTIEKIGGRSLRMARWHWHRTAGQTPLLFFNGIGANAESIAPLAEAMPDRPFLTFDMPGTGGSPDPVVPYNPALVAWTARQVLRKLDIARADVMGLSWGGMIAQHFALQHRRSTRRLVLAATNAGMVAVPGNPAALWELANPANWKARGLARFHAALMGAGIDDLKRLRPPSLRGYLYQAAALTGWTSAPFLPFLNLPTLIMAGNEDRIVPAANARILHRLIPHSQLEWFEGGGHLFLLGQRDRAAALLADFLDQPENTR